MKFASKTINILLLLLLTACQEKYEPAIDIMDEYLVVDGLLSDRRIPQEIKLTRSKQFNENSFYYSEKNAQVTIIDDLGNIYEYTEYEDGIYQSGLDFLGGEAGRSYHVRIVTSDGNIYESEPEELKTTDDISSIYCEYDEQAVREKDYYGRVNEKLLDGIQVNCDLGSEENTHNYFMFRWKGKYQYRLYVITLFGMQEEHFCRRSMHNKYHKQIAVFNLSDNENKFSKHNEMMFVTWEDIYDYEPDVEVQSIDGIVFEGMIVEFEQHCISKESYSYWNSVRNYAEADNHLFDPVSQQIEGNIKCINNPEKKVFGYFGCSGVKKKYKYLYMNGSNHAYTDDALTLPVDTMGCYDRLPDDYIFAPF